MTGPCNRACIRACVPRVGQLCDVSLETPALVQHTELPFTFRVRVLSSQLARRPGRAELLARGILHASASSRASCGALALQFPADSDDDKEMALALLQERVPNVSDAALLRYLAACDMQVRWQL